MRMTLNEYQDAARKTDCYPKNMLIPCHVLGLCGEAGEVAEKVKKAIRDHGGVFKTEEIVKELGDVLWYLANTAADLQIPLSDVAEMNLEKLASRVNRNKINGSGDNR